MIKIIAVGKIKEKFVKAQIAEYEKITALYQIRDYRSK